MLVGTGILNWNRSERITDRYGSFHLSINNNEQYINLDRSIEGKKGTLVAIVKETRESYHIGDIFRGIYPRTPSIDDKITLGAGTVFFEDESIGLKPDDDRDSDWLDPKALYRCHSQTVEIYFEQG